jgi:WD40 repeat protein
LKTGEPIRCYKGHDAAVNAVAFVPGKPLAISASEDMTLRMWDLPPVPDSN